MGDHIYPKLDAVTSCSDEERNSNYDKSSALVKDLYQEIVNISKNETRLHFLDKLIYNSIIIKNYPKRVIRKGTKKQNGIKFDASIMCLLTTEIEFSSVKIAAFMCSENQSSKILISPNSDPIPSLFRDHNCWTIKNMTYEPLDKSRSSRTSTCEKKIIVFEVQVTYTTLNFSKQLRKDLYSETVVLLTHSHQDVDCLITLFWDDYYREKVIHRFQFTCRDQSSFKDFVENLSDYFRRETNRGLTDKNKGYILQKVQELYKPSKNLKLSDFMKVILPSSKLSFGRWIMSTIKMLQIPTLKALWENDFIEGFVSKEPYALLRCEGSFLLRFSERKSAIGVVLNMDGNLEAWIPYDDGCLQKNNLANLLDSYEALEYIVKTDGALMDRDVAFEPYLDEIVINDGYTRRGGQIRPKESTCDNTLSPIDEPMENIVELNNNDLEERDSYNLDDILDTCNIVLNNFDSMEVN